MYFVAGLLVAGLVMMLILPAFWRRALRLSARRARLQTPLSVSEAIAERDQLRAEHSVAQRRLERRIETLQLELAEQRATLGRELKRAALDEEKARLTQEVMALRQQLDSKTQEALGLEAELGASRLALHDFGAQINRAVARIAALRHEAIRSETRTDEQRAAIAALETRAAGLDARLADQAQAFKIKFEALQAGRERDARDAGEKLADLAALDTALGEKDRLNRDLAGRLARVEEIGRDLASAPPKLDGDRALREAISRLGADVLRLAGQEEETSLLVAKLDAPVKREAFASLASGEKGKDGAPPPLRRARSTSSAP
jgi:chromosome segregation ATPase